MKKISKQTKEHIESVQLIALEKFIQEKIYDCAASVATHMPFILMRAEQMDWESALLNINASIRCLEKISRQVLLVKNMRLKSNKSK